MKYLLTLLAMALLLPTNAFAADAPWYEKQLELEAYNLEHYGNPFGITAKSSEMYDPVTLRPWWMIQLEKEEESMRLYGNPFGYPIKQRVLPDAPAIFQPAPVYTPYIAPVVPVIVPEPVIVVEEPVVQQPAVEPIVEPVIEPLNLRRTVWEEYWAHNGRMVRHIMLKAEWDSSDKGTIFCTTPNHPLGAFLDKDLASGWIIKIPTWGWSSGDRAVCRWNVGDEELTLDYMFTSG